MSGWWYAGLGISLLIFFALITGLMLWMLHVALREVDKSIEAHMREADLRRAELKEAEGEHE